jgi:hypothetical protein
MPVEATVAAAGPDWWANYLADAGLTEDRYIKAVEAKPGTAAATRVVHHEVASLVAPDDQPAAGGTLVEYAVGKNGDIYPEGAGKLMKAGSKIRFNCTTLAGSNLRSSQVGCSIKRLRPHVMTTVLAERRRPRHSSGADNVRGKYTRWIKRRASLVHAACTIAKRQCLEAIYPTWW